jgi:archaellum component FlaC
MLSTIVLALKDEIPNERQLGRILSSICKKIADEYQERQAALPSSCLSLSSLENYGLIITQRSINRLENRLAKVENQLTELKDTMSDIQVLLQQILTKLNDMEKKTSRRR